MLLVVTELQDVKQVQNSDAYCRIGHSLMDNGFARQPETLEAIHRQCIDDLDKGFRYIL